MTKLIFLDFDGVLNNIFTERQCVKRVDPSQEEQCRWPLDQRMVGYVQGLCRQTDAQIVVTSTWRKLFTLDQIGQMFEQKVGWENPPLLDVTPVLHNDIRGAEVQQWLSNTTLDVSNYVIIDDDSDFYDYQPLVKTHVIDGLTDREFQQALTFLTKTH